MNHLKISFLIVFFMAIFACRAFNQDLILKFSDSQKNLVIRHDQVNIISEWVTPAIKPALPDSGWKCSGSSSGEAELAGMLGFRTNDIFRNRNIEIERQVWLSNDKKVIAMRQKLINRSRDSLWLTNMIPLACRSADGLKLNGFPDPAGWNIMVQKRHKNDIPESFAPKGNCSVKADPFLVTPLVNEPNGQALLIGYLNQTDHLAHFNLSFKEDQGRTVFSALEGVCEFNGVLIPPGGERTTQWIYLSIGVTIESTISDYAEHVGKYLNVAPPESAPPSVYCTWYYHALYYNEENLKNDLQAFKERRVPFDVFLIDECWNINKWGDYMANEQFPGGLKHAADLIREVGYKPGIWSCPYLIDSASMLARSHPEWTLKTSRGDHYIFQMNGADHWVLDLTYPGVLKYLEESFRMLSRECGYQYFKFDFMRAVVLDEDFVFYNQQINRLEAYRMGLEAIRRGVGDKAYISVCGGHYGGSLGIANSQRSGSDVLSWWDNNELQKYRQNILRTWMSRLWHVDPDAMMVRRSELVLHPGDYADLSLGRLTDQEARVNALNQYVGGGLVTFTEDFATLDEDRLELYKHILPPVHSSSFPLDWNGNPVPSYMVTHIEPVCSDLGNWNTLAVINWSEQSKNCSFVLNDQVLKGLPGDQFMVFEFFSQQVKGIYKKNELVSLGSLAPHSPLQVKIVPWSGNTPVLAGTDLHFSMGGVEISQWKATDNSVAGRLETKWQYPVKITAAFPMIGGSYEIQTINVNSGQKDFWIENK
jgi:hypothetical protein